MYIYLFIFFFLSICAFLQPQKETNKFYLFSITVLFLILFAGLRKVGVAPDDGNYYDMFMYKAPDLADWLFGNFTYSLQEVYMEPGYVFLNSFLRYFTDEYTLLFLCVATLSVGIASYNYYRYSKYVFLTLVLFFVHTYLYRDMNQIRAAIACAIGLFLIAQIHKREHFKIILTLCVMGSFHIASLSLVFAYFLSFIKVTRTRVLIAYIAALAFGVVGISQIIFSIIPGGGFLAAKLHSYTVTENYINAVTLFDITNLKNSVILIAVLVFWNRLKEVIPYFETIIIFYLLAVGIRIAFWDLGVISARLATFFGIVEVILIPYFVCLFRQKALMKTIIILYAFMVLYLNLYSKEIIQPYELSIF